MISGTGKPRVHKSDMVRMNLGKPTTVAVFESKHQDAIWRSLASPKKSYAIFGFFAVLAIVLDVITFTTGKMFLLIITIPVDLLVFLSIFQYIRQSKRDRHESGVSEVREGISTALKNELGFDLSNAQMKKLMYTNTISLDDSEPDEEGTVVHLAVKEKLVMVMVIRCRSEEPDQQETSLEVILSENPGALNLVGLDEPETNQSQG